MSHIDVSAGCRCFEAMPFHILIYMSLSLYTFGVIQAIPHFSSGVDVLLNKESKRETPSVVTFTTKQRMMGTSAGTYYFSYVYVLIDGTIVVCIDKGRCLKILIV
jgi:hypothetical protein